MVYNSLDYNKQKEIFLKLSKTKTKKTIKKTYFYWEVNKGKKIRLANNGNK